ncbi:MAG: amidohydrolase [Candidatus ainarchaeum sp.]|nr:amidohydrolase [Candidatus ainarchaeum sp.]
MGLVVRNAVVLTQDAGRRVLKDCDVLVEGESISRVGKGLQGKAEFEIDGKGKLLLPGLVNCHTHAAMTVFRGLADDCEFFEGWEGRVWPAEKRLKPRHVYAGARLALLEMVRSGTTSFLDMYFFPDETARACRELGVRGVLGAPIFDAPVVDGGTEDTFRKSGGEGLVRFGTMPHAPYTVGEEGYRKAAAFAEREGCVLHTHVAETRREVHDVKKATGKRPVEWLESIGALSPRTVAAHCVWVTRQEAGILGRNGVTVAHCPVSGMKLAGGGVTPIPELSEAGANVTLGTDGAASNNSLDMIETMKVCSLLQKHSRWNAAAADAGQVLDFATRNGARALGIDGGSIEEGRLADFILLDLRHPNMLPVSSVGFAPLVVYSANPSNVCDVVVNGKPVLLGGRFASAPAEMIARDAEKAVAELHWA